MNTKSVLTTSFLIFNLSLPALAEDAPEEIIIEAKRETGGSTSSSGSVGGTQNQPFSKAGGTQTGDGYADAKAKEAAAREQGKKLEECGKQKNLIPISQNQCRAQVNTAMTNYSVGNCKESGQFSPSFSFSSTYFSFASTYSTVSYSTNAQCQQLTSTANNQFQTDCTTSGDLQIYNTCAAAGVK